VAELLYGYALSADNTYLLAESCARPVAASNLLFGRQLQRRSSWAWPNTPARMVPEAAAPNLFTRNRCERAQLKAFHTTDALPQQELLISRTWQTGTTTFSTGSGSPNLGELWGERHHRYRRRRSPTGLRCRIERGCPTGGTSVLVYRQAVRQYLPHRDPRVGVLRVGCHIPKVFQVKKT
jgi:hypothetical protein